MSMKKISLLLVLGLCCPTSLKAKAFDPETFTYLTFSDADSLDPAWSYDTASHAIILNVYEPLFWFHETSTEKLDPLIAAKVPSKANGLISPDGRTYTIPIRKGIKFHDGTPMTPEDVRYSIVRFLLFDRNAGPSSLLMQPILGYPSTRDESGKLKPDCWKDAMKAVEVKGDTLVLHIPKPYAPLLTLLASWAPALSKQWVVKNGGWDGSEATWAAFNNPKKESSPLHEKTNGTGPFKVERWDRATKQFILLRNDAYWRKPARLKRVIVKSVDDANARKLELAAGDADNIYADRPVYTQVSNIPGVDIIDDLPMMEMNPVAFFTFKINAAGNPYVGSGKLDGQGIPPDFFSDVDVRKGFAYSMDYAGFIRDVSRGKGTQATGCIPKSLPGYNPKQPVYSLDPKKAEEHFRKAFAGQVWDNGFTFTLTYNTANTPRQMLGQMLKRRVESLNPKFRIDVRPIDWPAFLDGQRNSKLPIFLLGWNADYPDPHNFAFPMVHSQGDYPHNQHYANAKADKLIDQALYETDIVKRKQLYAQVQAIEYDDVPHLVIQDTVRFRTQRDWVKGWYHNPIFPDAPYASYFYPMYKEQRKP
ncbi:MAG: ABC transporter substrate-binding protein [Elusimicrobia bacterium]|nr:ABC transporter substrate-binding protein [Elusimicrobiota bacterium]